MSDLSQNYGIVEWQIPDLLDNNEPESTSIVEIDEDALVLPSAEEIEKIQKDAYDEGFQNGLVEGRRKGEAEFDSAISLVNNISAQLNSLSSIQSDSLVDDVRNTIIAITKQVIRRELAISSEQIVSVVKEGLSLLPGLNSHIILKINPDDDQIIQSNIVDKMNLNVSVMHDLGLSPGGCNFETDTSKIDMSVETRMAKVLVNVMGGQRSDD